MPLENETASSGRHASTTTRNCVRVDVYISLCVCVYACMQNEADSAQ